jgi:hypothetical protein
VRLVQGILFVGLAGGGVALLSWAGGGFFGSGPSGERPQVEASDRAPPPGTGLALEQLVGDSRRTIPGRIGDEKTGSVGARESESRTWTDKPTGERFEFPRFLAWTFSASEIEPFRDATTGEQGFRYRDVRIVFYREPKTRAEAQALRDDPVAGRLLGLEVEADEGWASFAAQVATPDKPLVRLPKSARLRDHVRNLTVVCDDTTVDLDAGTAEGAGDLVAEHPACSLRGRGMRIDQHGSRFEILQGADVRLRDAGPSRRAGVVAGPEGSMRPSRVRAKGGAVLAPLAAAEGKGYRVVIERDVKIEQDDGPTLVADAAEVVVRPVEAAADSAASDAYALESFVAEGHVSMSRAGSEPADQPSLLSVFCDRLRHDPATGGVGLTVLEGDCRATYRGAFSPSEGSTTRGLVRASSRRSLSIGPAGDDHPAGDLRLTLDGDAVVERSEAAGAEAPERVEAPRIDLFLRSVRPAAVTSPTDPASFQAVAFTATGGVRLDGPRIAGSATALVGLDLDKSDFRLVAHGPDAEFEVADGARGTARGSGSAGARPLVDRTGTSSKGDRRRFDLVALRAQGDVQASLAGAGASPVRLEGHSLSYERATGAVLHGLGGRPAWMSTGAGADREHRVAAPRIAFRSAEGVLATEGETEATVWLGGARESRVAAPETDRVWVRGGRRISLAGRRAAGSPILVTIDGGGTLETRGPGGPGERLRAEHVEIEVGETATGSPAFFGGSGVAKPSTAATSPSATSAPAREATRWTIRSRGLEVHLAALGGGFDALRSFSAAGGVVAKTDDHVVEGERLAYDGASGVATVVAPPSGPASLRLGSGERAQRAWAREIEVALADGKPVRALLRRPATVVLFREGKGGAVERLRLRTEGDLHVTPEGAKAVGRTAVTRTEREAGGTEWSKPATLWTPDLAVEATGLLGGARAEIRRLVARGEGTRFESGEPGGDGMAAIGDSIVYDAVVGTVTVRDAKQTLFLQKGRRIESTWFTYDLKTGLPDFEGARMTLGGK